MRSALQVASVMLRGALLASVLSIGALSPAALADSLGPAPRQPVPPAPRASASEALGVIDRLPSSTRYVIAGRGLDELIAQFGATPIGLVASQQGIGPQVSAMITAIGTRAGWSGQQSMTNLLGDQAVLIALHPEKPGGPARWALLARVGKQTASHLQAKLEPQPGEVVDGLPVMAFDRGRYAMSLGRPFAQVGGAEQRWLLLCPREGSLAALLVPALNETSPPRLGAAQIARELPTMSDGTLVALADWSAQPGAWRSCAALGVTKAENGYDLSWQIREPDMGKAAMYTGTQGPSLHDDSILIGLSETRLPLGQLTPALRAITMLRAVEPDPARDNRNVQTGHRTLVLRRVDGALRLDASVFPIADAGAPSNMDRTMLALVASLENKPAQQLSLNLIVPRVTEVLPEQGTILRAVMGDRLSLWWSPEFGQASLVSDGQGHLPAWKPNGEASRRELTWINAGRLRPRELIAAIPADMRQRVGMIGLRTVMESLESIHWRMWFDGEGESTFVRGAGQLRLAPRTP